MVKIVSPADSLSSARNPGEAGDNCLTPTSGVTKTNKGDRDQNPVDDDDEAIEEYTLKNL